MIWLISVLMWWLSIVNEPQVVAVLQIAVDENGDYMYAYQVDEEYFEDVCHLLTFAALEGHVLCGGEKMAEYAQRFQIDSTRLNTRKF